MAIDKVKKYFESIGELDRILEFDESTANILMDKALDTLSYIYNNGNLINWR